MKKRRPRSKYAELKTVSLTVASPEIGLPKLTVGEIAERLHAIAPDTPATVERIRHWTRENLLSPVDQQHAGTGRHRHYAEESVYESAILTAIANAGIPVVSQGYLTRALPLVRNALQKWQKAKKDGRDLPLFLIISRSVDEQTDPAVRIHEGIVKQDPNAEISLTINLSRIFAHVLPPTSLVGS